MTSLIHFIAQQQVLVGLVGAALAGALAYSVRRVPGLIGVAIREQFAVTLTLESADTPFSHLNVWLARREQTKRARRVMVEESYDYESGEWGWEITLGQGWHLIRYAGRWLVLHRFVQQPDGLNKVLGGAPVGRLTIYTIGRDQRAVRLLLAEAKAAYMGDGLVSVHFWSRGSYVIADRRQKRPLDTVYMPEEQKRRIIGDLASFIGARDLYRERGVPWRRGYLFEGPPGTGKTTLIYAAAGLLDRAVYVINLNNVDGDDGLIAAFNEARSYGVVVIEDIDGAKITHDRQEVRAAEAGATVIAPPQKGVTLSGLLNAIDGIVSREGRVLFITSNHTDHLDPALLRPGRVDVREVIDRLGEAEAWRMYRAFRPDGDRARFIAMVGARLPIAAADLQNLLMTDDHSDLARAA